MIEPTHAKPKELMFYSEEYLEFKAYKNQLIYLKNVRI